MSSPSRFGFNTPDFRSLSISTDDPADRPRRSTRSGVSTLTGGSTVFDSAVASASTGSSGGEMGSNKLLGVIVVEDSSLLCRAVIPKSHGERVCAKRHSECMAASHTERAELEDRSLYVAPRKDQILLGNSISKKWLTSKEVAEAVADKRTRAVWFTWFDHIKSLFDVAEWEEVGDTPTSQVTLEDLGRGEEDLVSPKKVKLTELLGEFKDEETSFDDLLNRPGPIQRLASLVDEHGEVPKSLESLVEKLVGEWSSIEANFGALEDYTKSHGVNISELKRVLESVITNTEDKFKLLDSKAQIILALIGKEDEASDNGARSVWQAIRSAQSDLKQMKEDLTFEIMELDNKYVVRWQNLEKELGITKETTKNHTAMLEEFKKVYTEQTQEIFEKMSHLFDEFSAARDRVRGQGEANSSASAQTLLGLTVQLDQVERQLQGLLEANPVLKLQELTDKVALLQSQMHKISLGGREFSSTDASLDPQAGMQARAAQWAGGFGDLHTLRTNSPQRNDPLTGLRSQVPTSGSPQDSLQGMQKDINILRKHLLEVQKKLKGDSYTSGQYHFNSYLDACEFTERTGLDVGYYWDIFSVLVAMLSKRLDAKELSDFQYSTQRVKTTKLTSLLLSTMTSGRPKVFFGETADGKPKPMKEGMANCKSWHEWQGVHEPFKDVCTNDLNTFVEGVRGDLPTLDGFSEVPDKDQQEGIMLANHLLTEVQNQWTMILSFIHSSYTELVSRASFSDETAWILVGRYVAAVFNAMLKVRSASRALGDATTLKGRSTLFWSVLQCHRIMKEFIAEKFMGHPLIVKETSFFTLIDRVSLEQITGLKRDFQSEIERDRKRIKVLEDSKDWLTAQVKELNGKYSTLLNQYNQLKNKK